MKGIQIWAHSYCRSTLAFYASLAASIGVPFRIVLFQKGLGVRANLGLPQDEFASLDIVSFDDWEGARRLLQQRSDWHQLFGAYQAFSSCRRLIREAENLGCPIAVCSESPSIMANGFKAALKSLYLREILPHRVRGAIRASAFFVNFSGDRNCFLEELGWRPEQIVPCGYFSPALPSSEFRQRSELDRRDFRILCTGIPAWHRGTDLIGPAMALLRKLGVRVTAIITGTGPIVDALRSQAQAEDLQIEFPGFVTMPELIELYEQCSCYVATGRDEPWGIRVNDAIHCGAPLIISTGMGAAKLVNEHGCGITFASGDYIDLANKIALFASDEGSYKRAAANCVVAAQASQPEFAAGRVASAIRDRFPHWLSRH